jgi:hypothetical protein
VATPQDFGFIFLGIDIGISCAQLLKYLGNSSAACHHLSFLQWVFVPKTTKVAQSCTICIKLCALLHTSRYPTSSPVQFFHHCKYAMRKHPTKWLPALAPFPDLPEPKLFSSYVDLLLVITSLAYRVCTC